MRSFTMGRKSNIQAIRPSVANADRSFLNARRILGLSIFARSLSAMTAPLASVGAASSLMIKATALVAMTVSFYSGFSIIGADQAHADLRICNKSESRVGISIGYRSDRGWTTEGWWNLEPTSCEVILPGDLKSQYYYMFAVDYDEGGEWAGSAYMCTADKIYTIHGIKDCLARGFQRTGFFEIDTGTQTSWTVQLTEPTQRGTGGK